MDARRIIALVGLGVIGVIVAVVLLTSGDDRQPSVTASSAPTSPVVTTPTVAAPATTTATAPTAPPSLQLPDLGPHPDFLPVQEWIQTDATSFDDFDGKVIAVQFWTFGCSNCRATFPHMRDLYAKYGGDDFEIVGVHAPEFDFERDVDSVIAAAVDNGLTWPIAIDNDKLNFRSWQERRFWPRIMLVDRQGHLRFDHIGEGAYDDIDAAVAALIAETL